MLVGVYKHIVVAGVDVNIQFQILPSAQSNVVTQGTLGNIFLCFFHIHFIYLMLCNACKVAVKYGYGQPTK